MSPAATNAWRELVLITGISGSGKSVALHALEDAGYFCVDNLPAELLEPCVRLVHEKGSARVAIAADVRAVQSLPLLKPALARLREQGVAVRPVFLDASTDTLVRRFSETRRRHPLSDPSAADPTAQRALIEAIELERELLAELRELSTIIDTSELRPTQLRQWIRQIVQAPAASLTLVFESFAFKHGVPLDADYVFDVRMLPNPYYDRDLRPYTGRDAPVIAYFQQQPEVAEMVAQIEAFLRRWLPAFEQDQRAYLTVAVGCTGGQHRSVYLVEQLAQRFRARGSTLIRHRELDARDAAS
ncbi:RNase adapter RapZ [Caldimonas manganoxidans]|uniref:RNase adapter RapZ n=1 Tax=Caldimonas manganoxidans TaxID=196015 RepID=UPI00037672FE|nr:RNase adapter RapZ [Caldimonas manganoxidans]